MVPGDDGQAGCAGDIQGSHHGDRSGSHCQSMSAEETDNIKICC